MNYVRGGLRVVVLTNMLLVFFFGVKEMPCSMQAIHKSSKTVLLEVWQNSVGGTPFRPIILKVNKSGDFPSQTCSIKW